MTVQDKLSRNAQVRELTGHDEVTIRRRFGDDFDNLTGSLQPRALILVQKARGGVDEQAAYDEAMGLRLRDLDDYFGTDTADDEIDEDAPETPAGEGDSSSD